jgi:hypothetical protein
MALPLLVAVTVALVWLLAVGAAQVRVVDAARETARALARGDSTADAVGRGRRVAPAGSTVRVAEAAAEVTVTVSARVDGPGGLLGSFPAPEVRATAVAAVEGLPTTAVVP